MGKLSMPPTNGAAVPYDPTQVARGWIWRRDGWFAYLGAGMKAHQKKEVDKGVLALGGQNFEYKHNNQIVIGGRGGRDVEEEVRPVWSVGGDAIALIWVAIRTTKKKPNFNTPWPWTASNRLLYTQQPTKKEPECLRVV
jgi:hypothetical protein